MIILSICFSVAFMFTFPICFSPPMCEAIPAVYIFKDVYLCRFASPICFSRFVILSEILYVFRRSCLLAKASGHVVGCPSVVASPS